MIHVEPQAPAGPLEALARSERFVPWNMRAWACRRRGRRLPAEPMGGALADIGAPAAAEALAAAMAQLVLTAARPLAVGCPPHPRLSGDERTLLAAAAAAQHHDRDTLSAPFADILPAPASALVGRSLFEFGAALARVGVLPRAGGMGWPAAPAATLL